MPIHNVAVAQSIAAAGDMQTNIARHLGLMEAAADHGVQLLVFPELSLTGYELGAARSLAVEPGAALFAPLRAQAQRTGVNTVIGAPILDRQSNRLFIAALMLGSDGRLRVYKKRYLHGAEIARFTAGTEQVTVAIDDTRVALAICYDIVHPEHAARAARSAAQMYAAGVLISAPAYAAESELLRSYAQQHQMMVLMANHGAETGGWDSAGRSAIWAPGAAWSVAAPATGNLLVIAAREAGYWRGRVVDVAL